MRKINYSDVMFVNTVVMKKVVCMTKHVLYIHKKKKSNVRFVNTAVLKKVV